MKEAPWPERPIPEHTDVAIVAAIERSQLLIERFGYWPTSHDAEVLKLVFERGNHLQIVQTGAWSERIPESLVVRFYVFDWDRREETPPYRPTFVTLRFESLERFGLEGFNDQNPIIGLGITREYSANRRKDLFAVDWGGTAMSHEVSLTCERITVQSVEPIGA